LVICQPKVTIFRTKQSPYFRALKHYPASPKTLGEFLRQKRIDLQLSQRQLADILELGIADSAVEKWEKSQNCPTPEHRKGIVKFLGFDPAIIGPTGG